MTRADPDDVRRLLADARAGESPPDEVVARLDDVLAGLVEERADRPGTVPDELVAARRRRARSRRLGAGLVAAALVAVAGVGVGQVLTGGDTGDAASSADTDEAASSADTGGAVAEAPESSRSAEPPGPVTDLPRLSATRLGAGGGGVLGSGSASARRTGRTPGPLAPAAQRAGTCHADVVAGSGQRSLVALVDGDPALVVVDGRRVRAWACSPAPTGLLQVGGPRPVAAERLPD